MALVKDMCCYSAKVKKCLKGAVCNHLVTSGGDFADCTSCMIKIMSLLLKFRNKIHVVFSLYARLCIQKININALFQLCLGYMEL